MTATQNNLPELWTRMTETASCENLNLGLWLGQAKPAAIENEAVVLKFTHEHRNARDALECSENRDIVEKLLQAATDKLTTYQTLLTTDPAPRKPSDKETKSDLPMAGSVSPELAKKALDDPHIAKVVDIFKGRIVEVKHHVKEGANPAT